MSKFPHISAWLAGRLWAMERPKFEALSAGLSLLMELRTDERQVYIAALRADTEIAAAAARTVPTGNGVAVIPLWNTLVDRAGGIDAVSGATAMREFRSVLTGAANDPAIGTIVLDVDSPGGTVAGTLETAELVRRVASEKHVIAVAQTLAASAAFWIASQASELVVSPSGRVGSVGVVTQHVDESGALEQDGFSVEILTSSPFKAEGSPLGPLGDEARDEVMRNLRTVHNQFEAGLARGRGVTVEKVRVDFGQGRVFLAGEAVDRGMADRIGTIEDTVHDLINGRPRGRRRAGASSESAASADLIIGEMADALKGETK